MSKTVIISGGMLDEGFAEKVLEANPEAYIIAVDKGLEYLYNHKIEPQYIVGDFDSIDPKVIDYYRKETNIPIREYNPVKDATDTEIALRLGITLGSKEMILLGATGGRIDHLWANVQTLSVACDAGVNACILDEKNKIWVTNKSCVLKKSEAYGPYLSVFSLEGEIYDLHFIIHKLVAHRQTVARHQIMMIERPFRTLKTEIINLAFQRKYRKIWSVCF